MTGWLVPTAWRKCRIILEYDYKKIGECYGNSDVWARVVFYRAKNMLQKKLKEELHYEV